MKYFRLPPDPFLPVDEVFGESKDGDEEEGGESHCQRDGVYPGPGVGGYAGAGLQVVEHQVVGAGRVGQAGKGRSSNGHGNYPTTQPQSSLCGESKKQQRRLHNV